MQCVVSNCDHESNQNVQEITYHKFPEDPALRAAWLEAVDLVGLEPEEFSAVCSAHFPKEDLLVSCDGIRRLRAGAVPVVEVRACRICFITDCKLYSLTSQKILSKTYEIVTGLLIEDEDSLPVYLCSQCARRLVSCARFRTASLRAHLVLLEMVKNHGRITHELLRSFKESVSLNQPDGGANYDNDIDIGYIIKNVNGGQPRLPGHVADEDKMEQDVAQHVDDTGDKPSAVVLETPDPEHVAAGGIKVEVDSTEYDNKNAGDVCLSNSPQYVAVGHVKVEYDGVVERGGEDQSAGPSLRAKPEPGAGGQATRMSLYGRRPGAAVNPHLFPDTCSDQSSSSTLSTRLQIHSSAKLHSCDVCSKSFNLKDHLLKHSVTHSDERPYSCDVCRKTFKHKTYLTNHLRVHFGERPYSYHKAFPVQSALGGHQRIHSGEKPYSCKLCNKVFNQRSVLVRHWNTHGDKKPHLCDFCPKTFTRRDLATKHYMLHSGERLFSCDVCKRTFIYKYALSKHLRLHSKGKPYSCKVCKKAFIVEANLTKHLKIHTGDRTYSCDVCDKSFHYKHEIVRHMKKHSGEESNT